MQSVISDLTYAFRQIRRNMSTAAVCVLVLGIGIGSATAVFTVLYEAILKPLPYVNAEQLVYVHNEFPQAQLARTGESGRTSPTSPRIARFSATPLRIFSMISP